MADIPERTKMDAVDILKTYADFIRSDVRADDFERHPYLPYIEQTIEDIRAAPPAMDREAVEKVRSAASAMLPKNVCLTNPRWPDETVVPLETTLGELRALSDALSTLSADAIRQGEGAERQWPDIGDDPMKNRPFEDRIAASAAAIRKAYVKQQPIVPDQTALVWRWHLGALLDAEIRLRALLARDEATPASHASDGGTSNV